MLLCCLLYCCSFDSDWQAAFKAFKLGIIAFPALLGTVGWVVFWSHRPITVVVCSVIIMACSVALMYSYSNILSEFNFLKSTGASTGATGANTGAQNISGGITGNILDEEDYGNIEQNAINLTNIAGDGGGNDLD
jgi:hypothetical protein